jgi:hypothetical protein
MDDKDRIFLKAMRREGREKRMALVLGNCQKCGGRGYIPCPNCYYGIVSTQQGIPNIYAYRMGVWAECNRCLGDGWVLCDQHTGV